MAQLSPFELARLERIAANKAKLAELGMEQLKADMAKTNAAFAANRQSGTHKPRTSCPAGPRRTSNRVQGAPGELAELPDDFEEVKTRAGGVRKRRVTNGGEYTGPLLLSYPPVELPDGTFLERRRACHVCTQGEKSWRGDFPEPLWCTTCPLLYCHRCLFHISGCVDEEEAHEFIAQNQGTWMCFSCTKNCACQEPDLIKRYMRPLDRHKARGSVRRTERDKQARAEAATAHAAAQVTESDPAESPEGAVEEDDAASPAVASPSGEGGVRGRDGGAEAEAEAGAPAKGAAGGDEEEGEERVATPAKGPEKAAPSSDDVPSPASGSGAEGQSDESETPESAAAAAAGPAAKPRAAKRLATEETAGEEEAKSKWSMVAPATGHRLVGKKVWAYYDLYGWCRGEVIRWRQATNAHTLCFGKGTLAGGADDIEEVVFDGEDDTLLWGDEKPTEKPASVVAKQSKKQKRKK